MLESSSSCHFYLHGYRPHVHPEPRPIGVLISGHLVLVTLSTYYNKKTSDFWSEVLEFFMSMCDISLL
jgi:hypothetical protein